MFVVFRTKLVFPVLESHAQFLRADKASMIFSVSCSVINFCHNKFSYSNISHKNDPLEMVLFIC